MSSIRNVYYTTLDDYINEKVLALIEAIRQIFGYTGQKLLTPDYNFLSLGGGYLYDCTTSCSVIVP